MRTSSALRVLIVAMVVLGGHQAGAVNGPNAVETNGFPWVVPLSFGSEGFGFLGSASYITNGVVLTAAHNINTADLVRPNNTTNSIGQTYDRVAIGGQSYFALGVQDPLYAGAVGDPNDIGLYLVLNAPAVPGGVFPTLAKPGSTPLTTGSTIQVLGYGKSTNGLPIYGTMTMTNPAVNVTYNNYYFQRPPSSEITDPGDSGGPYIASNNVIVGVHTFGNTTTSAGGTRVDNHYGFATGDGQTNGAGATPAALDRLQGTANTSWTNATSWGRASTNFAMIPQDNDVAILDPTANSDAATIVTLDVDSAKLLGLLNDTTLKVQGHALNVTGASGVLNGGNIVVGGAAGSLLNVGFGFDNEGTLTISQNGTGFIGSALATGYTTFNTALFNGSNATVAITSGGSLAVTNGDSEASILNAAPNSLISVQGGASGAGTLTGSFIDNYGSNVVSQGGVLQLDSLYVNEFSGKLVVSGGVGGSSTANVASLQNYGVVNISTGGTVYSIFQLNDYGSISVAGGTLLTTNFLVSFVTNFSADLYGSSGVSTTGSVTMTSGNIGVTNGVTKATLNVQTGSFTMNGGNLSADRILVTNTAGLFSLNGGAVTDSFTQVTNGKAFTVGSNAVAASLTLGGVGFSATHTFGNALNIAVTANSTGSVFFSGNQLFITNGTTTVGMLGTGQMVVSNNGSFFGKNLIVGSTNGAQGTFSAVGSSFNQLSGSMSVGDLAGSTGTVFVTSAQLVLTNGSLNIGNAGFGQMTVSNAIVQAGNVNGPMAIIVGGTNGAQGKLMMAGGTFTSVGPMRIGDLSGAAGQVWVTGGLLNNSNAFTFVGNNGTGQMTVSNGTALLGGTVVGESAGSQGSLTALGGTVTLAGFFPSLTIGDNINATGAVLAAGGSFSVTNGSTFVGKSGIGQLTISNTTMQTRDVTIAAQSTSRGILTLKNGTLVTTMLANNTNGIVNGIGTIDGSMTSAGTISPGFSPGRIFVTGSLTLQPSSTVVIELGGTATNLYDQIYVGNILQVDGTLSVSLINSFDPALSNSFHIFNFASSGGEFALTNLPGLDPGLAWDTSNLMTDGDIIVVNVPEPSTLFLVFAGCGAVTLLRRRHSRRRDT